MAQEGYIYVLLRSDFIEHRQYVYKIGQTTRNPPHQRLWDYPYGSIFLSLIQTHQPIQFEKLLKQRLANSSTVKCLPQIGLEYYDGPLEEIIQIIATIYKIYNQMDLPLVSINEDHLLQLNRVHYLVNYDSEYFSPIYQTKVGSTNQLIPSEVIYQSYQRFRQWHVMGFPDNYVIRCGNTPIKPPKPVLYTTVNFDKIVKSSSSVNSCL
jgi:hypothetical protein